MRRLQADFAVAGGYGAGWFATGNLPVRHYSRP